MLKRYYLYDLFLVLKIFRLFCMQLLESLDYVSIFGYSG